MSILFHWFQIQKISPNDKIGLHVFLGIDLAVDARIGHAQRIRNFLRRDAVADAIDDKRPIDAGVLVIFHCHHVELPGAQIIGELLRHPHTSGTVPDVDLNALAFAHEQIGPVEFTAHGVR